MSELDTCIFCKIAQGGDEKTELIVQDEDLVVFRDIRPATPHHYLVVSKQHIPDPKHLNGEHVHLVEKMVETGKQVLEDKGADCSNIRMGFHWPPFHIVSHLHLHVIGSANEMGWIARGIFMPRSYWFVTAEWVIERIKKMKSKLSDSS